MDKPLFGPLPSRRLGMSQGIDLIPLTKEKMQGIIDFWNLQNVEIIASPPERSSIESYICQY